MVAFFGLFCLINNRRLIGQPLWENIMFYLIRFLCICSFHEINARCFAKQAERRCHLFDSVAALESQLEHIKKLNPATQ